MATCDVQALMDEAKCFMCLSPGQMQMLKLQLLCDAIDGNVWYAGNIPGDPENIDADPEVPVD